MSPPFEALPPDSWSQKRLRIEAEQAERRARGWGSGPESWHLDATLGVLWTQAPGYRFEVDLERMSDAGVMLDAIVQVSHKRWGTPALVGQLVEALDDLARLQQTVCGGGQMRGRLRWDTARQGFCVARRQDEP